VLSQGNGGKAAALNAGIAVAAGEIMVFADADGMFGKDTIGRLLEGFDGPDVGAVCGNDAPSNVDRLLPRLLALLTHVTSLVRRALSVTNCLSIVSGNCGAFRAHVVREIGGFTDGMVGEDLEITWRVHRAGYRVTFAPQALVRSEVPVTLGGLWKQRVRWTRGLIQTARMHRDMLCRRRFGAVSYFITLNLVTSLLLPPLQLLFLASLVVAAKLSAPTLAGLVISLTVTLAIADVVASVALDRSWRDLRLLYAVAGMVVYSPLLSMVVLWALVQEAGGVPARWNKLARQGVPAAKPVLVTAAARLSREMKLSLRRPGSLFLSIPGPGGLVNLRTQRGMPAGFVQVLNDRSVAWPRTRLDDTMTRALAVGRTDAADILFIAGAGRNRVCVLITGPVRVLDDAVLRRLHPRMRSAARGTKRPQAWVWLGVREARMQGGSARP
jgi:hypothetical protein